MFESETEQQLLHNFEDGEISEIRTDHTTYHILYT